MKEFVKKGFAECLKQEREQRSWSQEQVAEMLGTTAPNVSRWERGATFPGLYFRQKLCEIFGKTAEELHLLNAANDDGEQLPEPKAESQVLYSPAPKAKPLLWNLPHQRMPHFAGRGEALLYLHRLLHQDAPEAQTPAVAVSGLGGMGKTELALEYVYRHSEEYQAVFWVHAETRDTLLADFVAIARALNLVEAEQQEQHQTVAVVKEWFGRHSDWLVVLDELEEFSLLHAFLPFKCQGHIIVTTRSQSTGTFVQQMDLPKMDPDEGTLLLLRRAKRIGPKATLTHATDSQQATALVIAQFLDGLPLALDQAGAYIEEAACSVAHYCDLLQNHQTTLLGLRNLSSSMYIDHPHSVSVTLLLSLGRIKHVNPAALDLLYLCAFLHPDGIPEEIFIKGKPDLSPLLQAIAGDALKLDATIAELRKYSLLQRNPEAKTLSLHRLVQVVIKGKMDESLQRQWAIRAVQVINRVFPTVTHWVTSSLCQRYFSHAQVCVDLIEQWNIDCVEAGRLLAQLSCYLYEFSQYEFTSYAQAEPLLKKALVILTRQLGTEHPSVAEAQQFLGWVYTAIKSFDQAEACYRQALTIYEHMPEPDYHSISGCLADLADIHEEQGQYALAEPFYQRALEVSLQFQNSEHLDVAVDLRNLGRCYNRQKFYARAEPLLLQALDIWQKALGMEHIATASILYELAQSYLGQEEYARAKPLLLRSLAIRQQYLKPEHPYIVKTLNALARLYLGQGQHTQAESLLLQALDIQQKTPESTDATGRASILNSLAQLFHAKGDLIKAERLFQQAYTVYRETLGPDHPTIVELLKELKNLPLLTPPNNGLQTAQH